MLYRVTANCYQPKKWKIPRKTRSLLWRYGLSWTGNGEYYGYLSGSKFERLKEKLKGKGVALYIDNKFSQRSSNYRAEFFKRNPPFWKDYYICAYCGRFIHKNEITVDHLYPVNGAKKSIYLQKKLKRRGYKDINDPRNLIPACKPCNQKKSSRMDGWITKGQIGRHPWIWILRHILRIAILVALIYLAYRYHVFDKIIEIWREGLHFL